MTELLVIGLLAVFAVALAAFAIWCDVHQRRDVAMHRFVEKVMSPRLDNESADNA